MSQISPHAPIECALSGCRARARPARTVFPAGDTLAWGDCLMATIFLSMRGAVLAVRSERLRKARREKAVRCSSVLRRNSRCMLVWFLHSALSGMTATSLACRGRQHLRGGSPISTRGRQIFADANELHIPAGRPVLLELTSEDVIHSFWVPKLVGKMDMIPGRVNTLRLQADRPGVYGGQCAEFCGGAHALMGFIVVAHDPAEWQRWLDSKRNPSAASPSAVSAEATRGAQLFTEVGCAACHRIAGTAAQGLTGPDLTYVGARRSLGAGILPNNRGTLTGWIGDSQSIKPNNRMPAYRSLPAEDLNALAAYMESLR